MRNGEMSAVRNRDVQDFSESGMVRNRVLLGKMSTKKKECNENEKVLFSGIFRKKNQKYKRNPPRPPPFFGRLWRGITVFWHCEGGHKNQFRTPLEHFFKRDFFARWARNTRRGGPGGAAPPPLNGTQLRKIPHSPPLRKSILEYTFQLFGAVNSGSVLGKIGSQFYDHGRRYRRPWS